MEDLAALLFVLSSPNRLAMLSELRTSDFRLTSLAERMSATAQETSKHLTRLKDAKLVKKTSEGLYSLTMYGSYVSALLPQFDFLSKHREYFLSHDLTFLPARFIYRIRELSDAQYADHVSQVVAHADLVLQEAEEYVLGMADQCISEDGHGGLVEALFSRNVSVRDICARGEAQKARLPKSQRGSFEVREMDEVRMALGMNEKVAGVCFPDLDGRIDFSRGFVSTDGSFLKWCRDVFDYYWAESKRVSPEELHNTNAEEA